MVGNPEMQPVNARMVDPLIRKLQRTGSFGYRNRVLCTQYLSPSNTVKILTLLKIIASCQPEADGGARTVLFAGCSGYAMFQSIANEGLPVLHALCYSCHEGFALPFGLCFLANLMRYLLVLTRTHIESQNIRYVSNM